MDPTLPVARDDPTALLAIVNKRESVGAGMDHALERAPMSAPSEDMS